MSNQDEENPSTSVHQRLLNRAREAGRPFNEVLQYFAIERFLYRLSKSKYKPRFILKGGVLLNTWGGRGSRPTRDIDFLGVTSNQVEEIEATVKAICIQRVQPDGLTFDPDSIKGTQIVEDADYEGVRVKFRCSLGKARVPMQVDIGFGDVISPAPQEVDYPSILDLPKPELVGYTKESVVAEKFEAMVKLGVANSRMRDFYDIWRLSEQFRFDGEELGAAVKETFSIRGTDLEQVPVALRPVFSTAPGKQAQWVAFSKTSQLDDAPTELSEVSGQLARFLGPVTESLFEGIPFTGVWKPQGPWIPSSNTAEGD